MDIRKDKIREAVQNFQNLEHRMEHVATVRGVEFINDSKATAMDSVLVAVGAALEKTKNDSKLFLLLGGKDKNLPWEQLSVLTAYPNIKVVFFGACGQLAKEKTTLPGDYFSKLEGALNHCYLSAKAGDVVLLSPGGTSLDEFKNFEERGNFFKSYVNQKNVKH